MSEIPVQCFSACCASDRLGNGPKSWAPSKPRNALDRLELLPLGTLSGTNLASPRMDVSRDQIFSQNTVVSTLKHQMPCSLSVHKSHSFSLVLIRIWQHNSSILYVYLYRVINFFTVHNIACSHMQRRSAKIEIYKIVSFCFVWVLVPCIKE